MFFLRNLFYCIKQYLEIDSLYFFHFIEWLGPYQGRKLLLGFFFGFCAFRRYLYAPSVLCGVLGTFFFKMNLVFIYQKKKKKLYNVLKNIDEKEVIISSMMMLVLHVAILWLLVFHLVKSEGISMVFLFHISLMTFLCFYAYSKLNKQLNKKKEKENLSQVWILLVQFDLEITT